ncbi:MAG TPA: acyclic terpene utilization AtuA family protein [Terriglobales bacterium]
MRSLRIGAGAGYSGDRIDPAVELAEKGNLSYLVFECLAERTIAVAQEARLLQAAPGYDPLLEERMEAVLPACVRQRTRIISNMGGADPRAAAVKTRDIARRLGLRGVRIAAVTGDDVLELVRGGGAEEFPPDGPVPQSPISANAYLGAEPMIEALAAGADVVLTGRVADPSMFLAAIAYEFGWGMDDWNRLGQGTVIGHLLECAGQITGGYFADPGYKTVPNLAQLGFPLAEVAENGEAIITKVEGTGGRITRATCTEQLLYEIQNPAEYLTPDVTADFSRVSFTDMGPDRIHVSGGRGRPRPSTLKVSVGFRDGCVGEGQISYAGPGALSRAELARDILAARLGAGRLRELRFDFIGIDSILARRRPGPESEPYEVRLRAVARADSLKAASLVPREVEALYTNGPSGGGGAAGSARETIGIVSALVARASVPHRIDYEVA